MADTYRVASNSDPMVARGPPSAPANAAISAFAISVAAFDGTKLLETMLTANRMRRFAGVCHWIV